MGGVPSAPPEPPERLLHRLPPTLCTRSHTPATGCSKAPRGLLFPPGVPGLFGQDVGSPGSGWGQWGPRGSVHARRNLPDKAFGYLKRVRVTPGVYRPLSRLNPGFRDRHWPGFRSCTHPFGLAAPYVFIKQPGPPCHCDLRSQPRGQDRRHPFFRRYGANLPSSLATG